MSDSEPDQSDIVIKSALPKKKVKLPTSPVDNLKSNKGKVTTKTMIHEALTELQTRKGVSLHAIKKFLIDKYSVDTEKINFLIKKTINTGVKDGSIVQLKGVGASGSFKLAPIKQKPKAKPKSKEKKTEKTKIEKKTESQKPKKEKKNGPEKSKREKKTEPEIKMKKVKPKKTNEEKSLPTKKKDSKVDKKKGKKEIKTMEEIKETKKEKLNKKKKIMKTDKKSKMASAQTPLQKKAASIKVRRSIGNIIKPPKMNPKSSKN